MKDLWEGMGVGALFAVPILSILLPITCAVSEYSRGKQELLQNCMAHHSPKECRDAIDPLPGQ